MRCFFKQALFVLSMFFIVNEGMLNCATRAPQPHAYYNPTLDSSWPQLKQLKDQYYYEVLESKKSDSLEDITKKYRKLVVKYSPDKYPSPDERKITSEIFREVNNSYDMVATAVRIRPFDYIKPNAMQEWKADEPVWETNSDGTTKYDKSGARIQAKDLHGKLRYGAFIEEPVKEEIFYQVPPSIYDRPDTNKLKQDLLAATEKREADEKAATKDAARKLEDFKKSVQKEDFGELLTFMESNIDMVYKSENIESYRLLFESGLQKLNLKYPTETDIVLLNRLKTFYEKCRDKGVFKEYFGETFLPNYKTQWGLFILNVDNKIKKPEASNANPIQKSLIDLKMSLHKLKTKLGVVQNKLVQLRESFTKIKDVD